MKIAIDYKNVEQVKHALSAANGRSCQHTFNTVWEVQNCAADAVEKLRELLPASYWKGAIAVCVSGEKVSRNYRMKRNATKLVMKFNGEQWILTACEQVQVGYSGGSIEILLTAKQEEKALDFFLTKFKRQGNI